MDLTDFLLARIADDEAVANLARPDDHLHTRDRSFLRVEDARGYAHVAATSGRVLAECEAKRRRVKALNDRAPHPNAVPLLRKLLALEALPYADHPDYREEWRP